MTLWLRAKLGEHGEQARAVREMLALGWQAEARVGIEQVGPYDVGYCSLSLRSREGSTCTVKLYADELAVTSDFAQSIGHPDAAHLVRALELTSAPARAS